jgi:hypothetical protein
MKYLKLFESTNPADYFKELEEKTGIGIIKPEIDDLFFDLKDNLPNVKITDDLTINLAYRRKNVRKSELSYTYFDNVLKKGHKLFAIDINYLKDFLEKCEIATKISMEYWKQVNITIYNAEDLQTLKEDLQSIKDRSESLGYDFMISTYKAKEKMSIDILFNKVMEDWGHHQSFEDGSRLHLTVWMLFGCDLDESRLKSSIDFKSQIPANIISDFDKFVDKFRIPSKDKQELINIIKKGNWVGDN